MKWYILGALHDKGSILKEFAPLVGLLVVGRFWNRHPGLKAENKNSCMDPTFQREKKTTGVPIVCKKESNSYAICSLTLGCMGAGVEVRQGLRLPLLLPTGEAFLVMEGAVEELEASCSQDDHDGQRTCWWALWAHDFFLTWPHAFVLLKEFYFQCL